MDDHESVDTATANDWRRLRENLGQFALLVVVNAFVGAMIGLERSILPAIAEQEFQLAARTAVLSFTHGSACGESTITIRRAQQPLAEMHRPE